MLSLKTPLPADAQLPVFNEFFFWVCICAARPTCWRFLARFGRCPVYMMMMMHEARADPPRQRLKSTFFTDDRPLSVGNNALQYPIACNSILNRLSHSHSIILSHDNALIFQRKFFPRTMKNRLSKKNTVGWSRDPRGCHGAEAMLRV